ncbi:MAG: DNA translocase FtsK [Rikenellaceae bacterium]|nr:DNA translocase FtsK [Rikenellaceae bacterium]
MAQHKRSVNSRQQVQRTDRDSARWIAGLLIAFIGFFAAASVFFSLFAWEADQSGLQLTSEERETLGVTPENMCGWLGARVGMLLVDHSFGVFGILLPIIILLMGVRIIRQKPLLINHFALSLLLVMLLGSLTLGFAFGSKWSFCASTGWGGAFGIEVAEMLDKSIGGFGMVILLLGGWILTGVFINRNFITKVNNATNVLVDKGGQVVNLLRHRDRADADIEELYADDDEAIEEDELPVAETPVSEPVTVLPPKPQPQPVAQPVQHPEAPVTEPAVRPAMRDAVQRNLRGEDNPFEEVDLNPTPEQRVVLGAGGLVELERKPRRVVNGPFEEIDLEADEEPITEEPIVVLAAPQEPSASLEAEGFEVVDAPAAQPQQPATQPQQQPAAPQTTPPAEGLVVTVEVPKGDEMATKRELALEAYDPTKDLLKYKKPPITLLEDYQSDSEVTEAEIFENKAKIEETLANFGIPIQKIKATVGPTVTLYEIVQAQGVKISKIQGLEQDIAQSLKALGIRIIAPIPGKGTIGIEVPNQNKQIVSMYSAIRSKRFFESKAELPIVIGRTIQNENYVFDLAKMPHLLVAGATGTGKSVGLNAIITSLLYRKHPAELKLVMIDPKMVEFSLYAQLEHHFLAKMESEEKAIITDPMKAVYTLNSLCTEMDSRLELLSQAGTRNIVEYNQKFTARRLNPERGHRFLPYIVVVVDEFADLIMMAREVERPVMRLAQKARAVGIHLIIATQRPDVKVITGGIKANFPARIAFRVTQMIDSRTILDRPGANQLIGRGDMLFSKDGDMTRIQCALVETDEVERIVEYVAGQQGYTTAYTLPDYIPEGSDAPMGSDDEGSAPKKYDALFAEIARDAVESGSISTSMIQRNYEVGFNRAGRIMMQLERSGIVGRAQGAKPRDVLFHDLPSLEAKLQDLGLF